VIRCFVVSVALATTILAQSKQPPTPADFGQWESLVTQARGGLSPDGQWIAYGINRSNRDNELRIANVTDGTIRSAAFATQPSFSADSRWIAYAVGYSEAEEEKLRRQKKPIQRKLGLLNLASGETTTVDAIESFSFSAAGGHLAMRRYPPERKESTPTPPPADDPPPGAMLIVRDLATGRDTSFGSVTEFVWQDSGSRLAFVISSDDKTGNGVQLFDAGSASLRVLDSAPSVYSGLTWRKDADDLVVLRGKTDDQHDGPTHVALAWRHLSESESIPLVYDPSTDKSFPTGLRTVAFRKPTWSDDGRLVFLGVAPWGDKPPAGKKDDKEAELEEQATVDVWHARDIEVIPRQKLSARTDKQRNMLAVWHLDAGRLVQLGKDLREQVTPLKRQTLAYATTWGSYAMDRTIGRPAADLMLVDLATGQRTTIVDRIDDGYLQASPGGKYLLYWRDDHYWTVDTRTRAIVNITKTAPVTFVNRESDQATKQKPPFGVAGWTKDDDAVVIYDKFDLWQIASNGSRAVRLTDGTVDQVRHRYVRVNPDEEWIDADKPFAVSLFGIWTKKSGYGLIRANASTTTSSVPALQMTRGTAEPPRSNAASRVERLVWLDKSITNLAKAKSADVYAYVAQSFEDSPDIFVGDARLHTVKQVTATNPFQERFAWGRSELVEYKSETGERLQGALFYPAGYEAGKKYPMIVYLYERLSDGLHRYNAPSERDYYSASAFTSRGYLFFEPDIVFKPREPGVSVAECVGPAVKRVVAMGVADPARVGVVGHSWGGFDTTYLTTHTDIFAAGVAGAPITDLVSNYGNHHWSSGIAETDHIETGQQRMEVPLWEDLPAYIRNSAVFNVQNMKTPLLIEVGDKDGTVFWHQGIELYNIARRAKKNVVLLAYADEDHGLRKRANQLDYHRRIVEWFGHYLKNEPPPAWMTSGVSVLEREKELEQAKVKKGS
jgi:dipeptidyl aminopeptidase/acylaminoacyl peptidase